MTAGADGRFKVTAENIDYELKLEVNAAGWPARHSISRPWWLSQPPDLNDDILRVTVIGRYLGATGARPGGRGHRQSSPRWKTTPGIKLGLRYADDGANLPTDGLQAVADDAGRFRFPHVLADREFWVYAGWAALRITARSSTNAFDRVRAARFSTSAIWRSVKATRSPEGLSPAMANTFLLARPSGPKL